MKDLSLEILQTFPFTLTFWPKYDRLISTPTQGDFLRIEDLSMVPTAAELAHYYDKKVEGPFILLSIFSDISKVNELIVESIFNELHSSIVQAEVKAVIFDLAKVDYFNSLGLSLIVRIHKAVKSHNGKVALVQPNANIKELLHVTSLDSIWKIFPNVNEAKLALA